MDVSRQRAIFRAGSRTYFYSALFFPAPVRADVSILYAFVRQADNYVDSLPQDKDGFNAFAERYARALAAGPSGDLVIDSFIDLLRRKRFDPQWVESFLYSMELDTHKQEYRTIGETEEYIYGSAEVVGLMMARILNLPEAALEPARYLGKAMQYVNFIRDINEDQKLGRTYLPGAELAQFGLNSLRPAEAESKAEQFRRFIELQLTRYRQWQARAEEGYHFIPRRYLIPVKTAADMYRWTAAEIEREPLQVYRRVVKPSRARIVARVLYNLVTAR
ncbi:MAG: phytoene/squalene synthase family protein [Candidatus Margulisbacteria bacterium]|jgi:phytoene synthase|nr:phytoene/squalene synthase family protein [Candidatus Margulisiibacteriota bacterium]